MEHNLPKCYQKKRGFVQYCLFQGTSPPVQKVQTQLDAKPARTETPVMDGAHGDKW